MKFDLHTHHFRCGHADGNIRDYIEAGIQRGLHIIGISDHTPYFGRFSNQPFPRIAMAKHDFPNYVAEVLRLKEEYAGRIDVLLGVESDFFPDYANLYQQMLSRYPFDYIIGSVHHTSGVSIFNKHRWDSLSTAQKVNVKHLYYELIQKSAYSGMFHIVGHMDAMKGNYPAFSEIGGWGIIEDTLKVIAECNMAVEINTSGKTKLSGGWYPSDEIVARALHFGVDVTFGSDAHTPARVGDDWEAVQMRLKDIGFTHWVYFKEKQKVKVAI